MATSPALSLVPFKTASSCCNIADRAGAYGLPGVVVDGMDVLAVRDAVAAASPGGGLQSSSVSGNQ